MTGTSNTAGHELKFLPVNGPITGEVKTQLKQIFANDDTTSLANSAPRDLFDRLESGGLNPDTQDFLAIATAMIKYLQDSLGIKPAAAPSLSKEGGEGGLKGIVGAFGELLHGRRPLNEFTWRELLDLLIAGEFGKFEKTEVIAAFKATTVVAAALRNAHSTNGAIIVLKDDKSVEKTKTIKYISDLHGKSFMRATDEYEGLGTYTVEHAFGQHHMVTVNIFTGEIEYIGTVNQYGVDPGTLIERFPNRAQMVLWAFVTGHEAVRGLNTDKYSIGDYYQQLLAEKLTNVRWTDLERAFNRAVDRGDISESDFRLRMTEDQAKSLQTRYRGGVTVQVNVTQQPAEPVRDDSYYQRLLEEKAALNPETLVITGTSARHSGGVYDYIQINGVSARVTDIVVLKGGSVSGTSARVDGFTAPRVSVSNTGVSTRVSLRPATYESICRQLGLA